MNYSAGLEYIVGSPYSNDNYPTISYFSKSIGDNYGFVGEMPIMPVPEKTYREKAAKPQYQNQQSYSADYASQHLFSPEVFLKPSRPRAKIVDDNNEAKLIAEEVFELMMKEKMPKNISINILPFDEFKMVHSGFGAWSNGILGFSINNKGKKVFAMQNHMDELMLVIGHEIGHVLTETLPNRHDEEAKAFAFSIEWAKTIKRHNVANLGLSIKEEIDFQPARNGLHDVAFQFVDFMAKNGRNAIKLHEDLVKKYVSIFNVFYC